MPENAKPRVLVVDDEPQLRELLCDALGEDLDVSAAASGEEALEMARQSQPDLVVTDLYLGDCSGLDVIDRLRDLSPDLPAVVITGQPQNANITETSRRRPLEVLNKPLDLDRLKAAIGGELERRASQQRFRHRTQRLRRLARHFNLERKNARRQLDTTCADLTLGYRKLSGQLGLHKLASEFQQGLLRAQSDDDVFKNLFGLYVSHSGPIFGAAMVCDESAQLQLIGRFGVPGPDTAEFCHALAKPMIDAVLADPRPTLVDAGEETDRFDPSVRRYLPGLSVLAVPLVPSEGQMIGLVLLYRKGEQPFLETDVALAGMISLPAALAVQRNG